jgi:ligand-binding sensor domain-containing protein
MDPSLFKYKMNVKGYLWGWIFLCLGIHNLAAQDPVSISYTTEDGLPSDEVYDAYEDRLGNIWFATDHGVSRFDGYGFENFTTADGLSDNTVFGFAEDPHGRVWMRCLDGSMSYLEDSKLAPYEHNVQLRRFLNGKFIETCYFDDGHRMYFTTSGNPPSTQVLDLLQGKVHAPAMPQGRWAGLYHFGNQGQRIPFLAIDEAACAAASDSLKQMYCGPQMQIWRLPPAQLHPTYSRNVNVSLGASTDVGIYASRIYQIEGCHVKAQQQLPEWVRGIDRDLDGNLWLTGWNGMVLLGDSLVFGRSFFARETVFRIMQARNGSYWITTNHGVRQVHDMRSCFHTSANGHALAGVKRMVPAGDQLYLIYDDNAIMRLRMNGLQLEWEGGLEMRIKSGPLHDIAMLPENDQLLVSIGSIDVVQQKTVFVPAWYCIEGTPWQFRIQEPDLYVATNKGFAIFDRTAGMGVAQDRFQAKGLLCTAILEDEIGRVWVGSSDGLTVYDRQELTVIASTDGIIKRRVTDFALLDGNIVVVATRGSGLCFVKGGQIQCMDTDQGLLSDMCDRLYLGPSGLWVCSNEGLSLLPRDALTWHRITSCKPINFGIPEGLPTHKVNDVIEYQGYTYIATDRGIVAMASPTQPPMTLAPKVAISGLKAGNQWMAQDEALRPDQDNLEFQFQVGAMPSTDNLRYRYRLDGCDVDWRITRERTATYYDLKPGDYTFRVAAYYADRPGQTLVSERRVHLPYRLHETLWFRACMGLLVLLATLLGLQWYWRSRHRRIQSNLNRLQAEVKALRSQMQPHFMFNALTSIQHLILMNDNATAQRHLVGFAQLMRGILESIRQETIPISEEVTLLEGYLQLEKLRFGDALMFTIDLDPSVDWTRQSIPPMLLQPLVENAIWHGLQMQKVDPTLCLRFGLAEPGYVCCEVQDNGVGRAAAAKVKRSHLGPSIALDNIRSRISLINATKKSPMRITIVDLTSAEGKPCGTLVKLYLPLNQHDPSEK